MKKIAIPVALIALMFAATAGAQDGSQGPDISQQVLPDGIDPTKPIGTTEAPAGQLTDEMQATVDELVRQQQSSLPGGDEATACEAILCLSTGSPPGECASSLRRYFSINLSKPWKTIQARINFLKLCPAAEETPQMSSLVDAIGHSAGRCDANSLNSSLRVWTGIDGEYEISNQMPSYCEDYFSHMYATDINSIRPRYVEKYIVRTYQDSEGNTHVEYDGGYWVDPQASAPVAANDTNGAIPASKDPAAVGY